MPLSKIESASLETAITADSLGVTGNLAFTGTGNRITGDFSNATLANRAMFQNSVTNGATSVGAMPNGTGTNCAYNIFAGSDPANTSFGQFRVGTDTSDVRISSGIIGTGTYLPMTFYTGGSERVRVDTSGNVGIGTSSPTVKLDVTGSVLVSGSVKAEQFAGSTVLTDSTARTYSANTVYTIPGNVSIISGGADTFFVTIFIQYDGVGYHNLTGAVPISLTYWNAYGNSSQWSTQMSTHVNGNPTVTIYDTTGSGSRPIAFSLSSPVTVTSGGFVKVTLTRMAAN